MFSMFAQYLRWIFKTQSYWFDQEFFRPVLSGAASACRLALGVACVFFFISWYGSFDSWTSADGPLGQSAARFLILDGVEGSGSQYRLSPFFLTDSVALQIAILLGGTLASLVLVSGFGGRVIPIVVWLLMLSVLHRVSMIQSLGDVLLCSMIPYLAIDNGWLTQPTRVGFSDDQKRWTARLAIGIMRWHLILWLCISFANHLSQSMWWNGNAVWNIVVNGQSPALSPSMFAERLWLSPWISNAWLILHLLLIICLIVEKLRPLAIAVAILFWSGVYILGGDLFYAISGIAATSCVFYESTLIVKRLLREETSAA